MQTLLELSGEFRELYEIASEDDDPKALIDTIESMMAEIETKAEGYVAVCKRLDMEAKAAKENAEYFKNKQRIYEDNIARMKRALLMAMDIMDVSEIPAGMFTIKAHKNGGKAPLEIDGEVPDNMTKVIVEPDKEKIREYLESQPDQKCEWAHLVPRGRHIVFK